ncbi:MAG: hypothetical protein ACJ8CB_07930, partial [Ktedonobacteraceae bacterium]
APAGATPGKIEGHDRTCRCFAASTMRYVGALIAVLSISPDLNFQQGNRSPRGSRASFAEELP